MARRISMDPGNGMELWPMPRAQESQDRPDKKKRRSVYLDPELMRLLVDFADRREQSRSVVAEAAIASFLSPDADERQEAAIAKRLDRIDRNVQRLRARHRHRQRGFR